MDSTFSTRLVRLRKEHNLTQKQAAAGMGLSEIGIQNFENCRRLPKFETLIKVADFFDVSADYLLGRSNNPARLP